MNPHGSGDRESMEWSRSDPGGWKGSKCSCGNWHCSCRRLMECQDLTEQYYWSNKRLPVINQEGLSLDFLKINEGQSMLQQVIPEEGPIVAIVVEANANEDMVTDGDEIAGNHDKFDDAVSKVGSSQLGVQEEMDLKNFLEGSEGFGIGKALSLTIVKREDDVRATTEEISFLNCDSAGPDVFGFNAYLDNIKTEEYDEMDLWNSAGDGIGNRIEYRPSYPDCNNVTSKTLEPLPPLLAPEVSLSNIKQEPMSDDAGEDAFNENTPPPDLINEPDQSTAITVPNPVFVRRSVRRSSKMRYQCSTPSCGKVFFHQDALIMHEKEHNLGDMTPFQCPLCRRCYANQTTYNLHLQRHRQCKECGHPLKNAPFSKAARDSVSPQDEYCLPCFQKMSRRRVMRCQEEPREEDSSTELEGDDESEVAEDEQSLDKNMDVDDKLECGVCGKLFKYEKWYKLHVEDHSNAKNIRWNCSTCPEVFTTKRGLQQHEKESHPEKLKFGCSKCKRRFRLQHHLNHHMTVHSENKEFTCTVCGRKLGSLCSLKTHERRSTNCYKELSKSKKIDK